MAIIVKVYDLLLIKLRKLKLNSPVKCVTADQRQADLKMFSCATKITNFRLIIIIIRGYLSVLWLIQRHNNFFILKPFIVKFIQTGSMPWK